MIPSKKKIDELKELVKRDFGVELTDRDATDGQEIDYFLMDRK